MAMSDDEIREICKERLASWTDRLVEQQSTPLMLLGMGHDHKEGQLLILTVEDISDKDAASILKSALSKFETGRAMRAR